MVITNNTNISRKIIVGFSLSMFLLMGGYGPGGSREATQRAKKTKTPEHVVQSALKIINEVYNK
jgi:CHASE3 domain sensor protein